MKRSIILAFLLVIKMVGADESLGTNVYCPSGWINSAEGCYLFQFTKSVTWRAAQEECESLGGFLAEIKNEEQARFLVRNSYFNMT